MNQKKKAPGRPRAKTALAKVTPEARTEAALRRVRPIRVMISSRNKDLIKPATGRKKVPLIDVRRELKAELDEMTFCGEKLLDVWINEEAGAESGSETVWDVCREKLRDAHVIIAIYDGEAGWLREGTGLGICHEEIKYAFDHFPSRLYVVEIPSNAEATPSNLAFARFMDQVNRWRDQATDVESLKAKVRLAVAKAVSDLTITGSREGRKGNYYFGSPLDWSRLGYLERKARIEEATTEFLLDFGARELVGPEPAEGAPGLVWDADGAHVLLLVHGVPSSFSIAEARELVGRPYLFDHLTPAAASSHLAGPVHIIACHKSCTESQVYSFLGHPDVYIVKTPFGFFATDLSSFVQTFFLTNCRDRDSTVMALERMFEWIHEADEMRAIVARARSRQRILASVRAEIEAHSGPRSAFRALLQEIGEAMPPLPVVVDLLEPAVMSAIEAPGPDGWS